jgi:hypothetical protein
VDDDGGVVTVRATAPNYDLLLEFTNVLEGPFGINAGIADVRVRSIGSTLGSLVTAEQELYGLIPDLLLRDETGDGGILPGQVELPVGSSAGKPALELELQR